MDQFSTLEDCFDKCWDLIFRATVKKNDPMRTPVMGTYDGEHCQLRTIVLRKSTKIERRLQFFTDIRSAKVDHIKSGSSVSLCFWHTSHKLQIRARGRADLIQASEQAEKIWQDLSNAGRKSYATVKAPGTALDAYSDGLPEFWENALDKSKTDFAFKNFTLLEVLVEDIDCLHLHSDGHQRATFTWNGTEWEKTWNVP